MSKFCFISVGVSNSSCLGSGSVTSVITCCFFNSEPGTNPLLCLLAIQQGHLQHSMGDVAVLYMHSTKNLPQMYSMYMSFPLGPSELHGVCLSELPEHLSFSGAGCSP